jgi:hypothetical protein
MAIATTLSRRDFLLLPPALMSAVVGPTQKPRASAQPRNMFVPAILPELPSAVSNLWLSRYSFELGGDTGTFARTSSALLMVQSGEIELRSDLPIIYRKAGEVGFAPLSTVPPEGMHLDIGYGALISDHSNMSLRNVGNDSAQVLMLIVYPRSEDDPSVIPATNGVCQEGLGAGLLTFHTGKAILILEQFVLRPCHRALSSTMEGTEVGALQAGKPACSAIEGRHGQPQD